MTLTPKQEAFARKYVECSNATQSYRHAYSTDNMKPATVNREAKELIDTPKIAARINQLKQQLTDALLEEIKIDRKFVTEEILGAIERSKLRDDNNVVLKGCEQLSKMYDLNKEKQNDRGLSDQNKEALVKTLHKRLLDVTPEVKDEQVSLSVERMERNE